LVARTKRVLADQKKLLDAVEQAALARLEVGNVSLADVTQVSLGRSRIIDGLQGLDEQRRRHEAMLREALSVTSATELPVQPAEPRVMLPGEDEATLREGARSNPRVTSLELMARSKEEAADRAFAEGLPGFSLGLDWIETGAAANAGVPDSGKDAVQIHFGVSVPLWRHVYSANEDRAHSEGRALLARRDAAEDDAVAAADTALSEVRDGFRRVRLYRDTLLPQAETVIESVLGGYQVGETSLASVLIAQRDLLELQLGLLRAQADHAIAWAQLEEIVGRKIRAGEGA
ncbi:MAG: TolC family protein, partial [Polyangiaceae bacterium]